MDAQNKEGLDRIDRLAERLDATIDTQRMEIDRKLVLRIALLAKTLITLFATARRLWRVSLWRRRSRRQRQSP